MKIFRVIFYDILDAKNVRAAREQQSLFKTLPTEIERTIIHDLFMKSINPNNMRGKLPQNQCVFLGFTQKVFNNLLIHSVWMRDAKLENLVICYPVKRNLYGKIFGGYLVNYLSFNVYRFHFFFFTILADASCI